MQYLGYQYENSDLLAALASVRRHLEPGGLFIFDVWNGLAVLADRPGPRVREVTAGPARIIRTTDAQLDLPHQRCRVHFHMQRIGADGVREEHEEEHVMRFFFPLELDLALRCSGLHLLDLRGFPDYEAQPDERSWNVIGVAQAQ